MATKPLQLLAAKESGFLIADTLISNNADKIKSIYSKNKIFAKAVHHHFIEYPSGILNNAYGHTNQKIFENKNYKLAPTIFQKKLSKIKEIRVFYINGELIASKYNNIKNDDWHLDGISNMKINSIMVPNDVQSKVQLLMEKLKLNYGAIDLGIVNNKCYFFEVNPTGDWRWLESKTNQNISDKVANYIINSIERR